MDQQSSDTCQGPTVVPSTSNLEIVEQNENCQHTGTIQEAATDSDFFTESDADAHEDSMIGSKVSDQLEETYIPTENDEPMEQEYTEQPGEISNVKSVEMKEKEQDKDRFTQASTDVSFPLDSTTVLQNEPHKEDYVDSKQTDNRSDKENVLPGQENLKALQKIRSNLSGSQTETKSRKLSDKSAELKTNTSVTTLKANASAGKKDSTVSVNAPGTDESKTENAAKKQPESKIRQTKASQLRAGNGKIGIKTSNITKDVPPVRMQNAPIAESNNCQNKSRTRIMNRSITAKQQNLSNSGEYTKEDKRDKVILPVKEETNKIRKPLAPVRSLGQIKQTSAPRKVSGSPSKPDQKLTSTPIQSPDCSTNVQSKANILRPKTSSATRISVKSDEIVKLRPISQGVSSPSLKATAVNTNTRKLVKDSAVINRTNLSNLQPKISNRLNVNKTLQSNSKTNILNKISNRKPESKLSQVKEPKISEIIISKLKYVSTGFDALAVLISYLVDNLGAFDTPKLKKKFEIESKKWMDTTKQLEYFQDSYGTVQETLNRERLFHNEEISHVQKKYSDEIAVLLTENEKQVMETQKIKEEFIKTSSQTLAEISEVRKLLDEALREKDLLANENSRLQGEVSELNTKYEELKRVSNNSFINPEKYREIQDEVRSLRSVLDLKSNELLELRRHNTALSAATQAFPTTAQRITSLQSRIEDLQAQLQQKVTHERRLSLENLKLQESFKEETKMKQRLLQFNEQLQWKLKQNSEVVTVLANLSNASITSSMYMTPTRDNKRMASSYVQNKFPMRPHSASSFPLEKEQLDCGDSPKIRAMEEKNGSVSYMLDMEEPSDSIISSLISCSEGFKGRFVHRQSSSPALSLEENASPEHRLDDPDNSQTSRFWEMYDDRHDGEFVNHLGSSTPKQKGDLDLEEMTDNDCSNIPLCGDVQSDITNDDESLQSHSISPVADDNKKISCSNYDGNGPVLPLEDIKIGEITEFCDSTACQVQSSVMKDHATSNNRCIEVSMP